MKTKQRKICVDAYLLQNKFSENVYFIVIFILAVLNALYREIRDLNAKLTRVMQINAIDSFYKTKLEK